MDYMYRNKVPVPACIYRCYNHYNPLFCIMNCYKTLTGSGNSAPVISSLKFVLTYLFMKIYRSCDSLNDNGLGIPNKLQQPVLYLLAKKITELLQIV